MNPPTRRYSGRATVWLSYVPDKEQYVFTVRVGGKTVNSCAVGPVASWPYAYRSTPEALDEMAKSALSFTVYELEQDNCPANESGLDSEDFDAVLDHDEDTYEVVVSRTPTGARRHGKF